MARRSSRRAASAFATDALGAGIREGQVMKHYTIREVVILVLAVAICIGAISMLTHCQMPLR